MKLANRTALVLALIAAPLWVQAQTATTETTEETTSEETAAEETPAADPEAEPAPEELSLGEVAQPVPYIKSEEGDWKVQCLRDPAIAEGEEDPNEECQLFQELQDENGTKVAEVTLFRLPDGQQAVAGANILVPLETLLSAQLTIRVDQGKARRYPFRVCSPIGCFASVGFTAQDIQAMKKGALAKVIIRPAPAPDQVVGLDMSLTGFTAAFDSLKPLKQ